MAPDRKPPRHKDDVIDWFTVSYRTLYLIGGGVLLLAAGAGYYYWKRGAPPPSPPTTVATPTASGARFNTIEGNVQVRHAGTLEWRNADRAMVLSRADLVRTGSGGSAEIRYADGTIFHVRPESLITFEESSENQVSRSRDNRLRIESGEANFQTPQRGATGGSTTIITPTVTTKAGDDVAGNIAVADRGDTAVRVFRGTVGTETKTGQKVQLGTNEAMKVDASGAAGPKIILPGVPTLLAPPHQAEIAYVDPARSTTLLAWQAVPGAATYHLVLDFNPSFTRPMVDRKGLDGPSMQLRGLEVGSYYWKVAAVDKDGVEGSFSEFARFTVTKPQQNATQAPAPPLSMETLEARGNILQVKGKTEPGASLTVNGQRIDVAANGTFNEYITIEAGSKPMVVVVRVVGINGGVKEEKRPVVISF